MWGDQKAVRETDSSENGFASSTNYSHSIFSSYAVPWKMTHLNFICGF